MHRIKDQTIGLLLHFPFKALFIKLRQNGENETFEKRVASFIQQIVVEPNNK